MGRSAPFFWIVLDSADWIMLDLFPLPSLPHRMPHNCQRPRQRSSLPGTDSSFSNVFRTRKGSGLENMVDPCSCCPAWSSRITSPRPRCPRAGVKRSSSTFSTELIRMMAVGDCKNLIPFHFFFDIFSFGSTQPNSPNLFFLYGSVFFAGTLRDTRQSSAHL